jgi:hypothetical protein
MQSKEQAMRALFPSTYRTFSHPTSWMFRRTEAGMGLLVSSLLFSVSTPGFGVVITRIVNRVFHRGKTPLVIREKQEAMQTLDEWKTVLAKDFLKLHHLEGQDAATRMRRSMKEQEIGQHCCQAGERLSDADLTALKAALGLDERQWHAHQSKVRPAPE